MASAHIHLTETPRDAMQSFKKNIVTRLKADYINLLLKCGFETVDAGSFVSPKVVPQMADSAEVLSMLETGTSGSKVMVLVGNVKGGIQAAAQHKVNLVGFPYSVSGTFLKRNLNTTPEAAWQTVLDLQSVCKKSQKQLRVYITMAFGNPYGDKWNDEMVISEVEKLYALGIRDLVFSDITGEGTPANLAKLCSKLVKLFQGAQLGIHLHTKPGDWQQKVEAAWTAGIRNFEGAIGGIGGCPMTGFELLGNLNTSELISWCIDNRILTHIDEVAFAEAKLMAKKIFN